MRHDQLMPWLHVKYFSFRRRPSEIILPKISSILFQRLIAAQLVDIFQHVQCR